MKKVMNKHIVTFPIVLLILGLTACKKAALDPDPMVDYIQFEGKVYVEGTNKPPRKKPLEMHLYMDTSILGLTFREVVDTFYTDADGNFSYRFIPNKKPNNYRIHPVFMINYSVFNTFSAEKMGVNRKDIKILAISSLDLELENANFSNMDTLFLLEPYGEFIYYNSAININTFFKSRYWSYENLEFNFRLKRNGIDSSWVMNFYLEEDSSYYYKVRY